MRGFVSSAVIHALIAAIVLGLSLLAHWQLPLDHNGLVPGAPVVSLETIVIVAPPAQVDPAAPIAPGSDFIDDAPSPDLATMAMHDALHPVPREPLVPAQPIIGLPLLPEIPTMTMQAVSAKTGALLYPETVAVSSSGGGIVHLRPSTDKFVSDYDAGLSVLPHPPYPDEARDLQQTGFVRMLVQFDKAGNVTSADVAESSGVAVLDSQTRAFIRDNWHSTTYAGRAISVPVEYTLTSL